MSIKSAHKITILAAVLCVTVVSCADKPLDDENARTEVNRIFAIYERNGSMANQAVIADQLEALGPSARPAIEVYLQGKSPAVKTLALISAQRIMVQRGGRRFTAEDVNSYLKMLSDSDVIVRTYAMECLIAAGPKYKAQILAFKKEANSSISDKLDIVLREQR